MLSIKTKIVKFKSAKLSKEILFKNNSVLQELIRKECTIMRSFTLRVDAPEFQCLGAISAYLGARTSFFLVIMKTRYPRTGLEVTERENTFVRISIKVKNIVEIILLRNLPISACRIFFMKRNS